MRTGSRIEVDDLQWYILSGLLDHPQVAKNCSAFWFADKPLRMQIFNALLDFKDGPVDLVELNDACQNVLPTQIFNLASSPRPYKKKLSRLIEMLSLVLDSEREAEIVEI